MILRKPYAFLIRHFKLIHLILLAAMSFLIYKSINILNFFNTYISNDQKISALEDISGMYVSGFMIFLSIFIVLISAIVMYLMKHKSKPIKYYIFTTTFYLLLIILFSVISNFLYDVRFSVPDLRITNILKDLMFASIVMQGLLIIVALVRATGFNIKNFDFKKDLMDFELSEKDREEYEFQLKLDSEDIKASIRKRLRFFKYYYKENKIIFIVLGIVLLIFIGYSSYKSYSSKEKIYSENSIFSIGNFKIKVLNSYKVLTDNNDVKFNDKNYYLVLRLEVNNNSNNDSNLYINNAKLSYSDMYSTSPTTTMYDRLQEFGEPYYNQIIKSNSTDEFQVVYQVPIEYYDNDVTLKFLYGASYVNNRIEYQYRTVDLDPIVYDGNKKYVSTKNIGETLSFDGSLLKDTKLTIKDYKFDTKFVYTLRKCINKKCSNTINVVTQSTTSKYDTVLLRIDYDLVYDESLGEDFNINKFISKYGNFRFVIDGKEYNHKMVPIDRTPYDNNNFAFIQVRERLMEAEEVYMDFTIRDKVYTYVLKNDNEKEEEKPKEEDKKTDGNVKFEDLF